MPILPPPPPNLRVRKPDGYALSHCVQFSYDNMKFILNYFSEKATKIGDHKSDRKVAKVVALVRLAFDDYAIKNGKLMSRMLIWRCCAPLAKNR